MPRRAPHFAPTEDSHRPVAIPHADGTWYLGMEVDTFDLRHVLRPSPYVASDAYTHVYVWTDTGGAFTVSAGGRGDWALRGSVVGADGERTAVEPVGVARSSNVGIAVGAPLPLLAGTGTVTRIVLTSCKDVYAQAPASVVCEAPPSLTRSLQRGTRLALISEKLLGHVRNRAARRGTPER